MVPSATSPLLTPFLVFPDILVHRLEHPPFFGSSALGRGRQIGLLLGQRAGGVRSLSLTPDIPYPCQCCQANPAHLVCSSSNFVQKVGREVKHPRGWGGRRRLIKDLGSGIEDKENKSLGLSPGLVGARGWEAPCHRQDALGVAGLPGGA